MFNYTAIQSVDSWYVYIVRCADDSLYTGVTKDVTRRIEEHNCHHKKGARYTRNRRPVTLEYVQRMNNRAEATRRESEIKRLSRCDKQSLIGAHQTKA